MCRASSSMKIGTPPASSAMRRASSGGPRMFLAACRAPSSADMGPTSSSRTGEVVRPPSSPERKRETAALCDRSSSSERALMISSAAGAPGLRSSSRRKVTLSASLHCMSSIWITTRPAPQSVPSRSRRLAYAWRRSSRALASAASGSPSSPVTQGNASSMTGKTRVSTACSGVKTSSCTPSGSEARWRVRASMIGSSALYGTASFS